MPTDVSALAELDRLIHEPARLALTAILSVVDSADFLYLQHETGLTKGNLSAHLARLEAAGYVTIEKTYRGKVPQTLVALTENGRSAFEIYRKQLTAFINHLSE